MSSTEKLNGYDRIAPLYDALAKVVFGDTLKKAQQFFLSSIKADDRVLVIGGGSGWIAKEISIIQPKAAIWYVEASSEMIALAKGKFPNKDTVHFVHGTTRHLPETEFDVVVTNFFLDQFDEFHLREMIGRVMVNLKKGSIWIATDFVNSPKLRHRLLLKFMYVFFRFSTGILASQLPEWKQILTQCGLTLQSEEHFGKGLVSSSLFFKK